MKLIPLQKQINPMNTSIWLSPDMQDAYLNIQKCSQQQELPAAPPDKCASLADHCHFSANPHVSSLPQAWHLHSKLEIGEYTSQLLRLKSTCLYVTWKWGFEHVFENRRIHPIQEMIIWRKWLPLKDKKGNLNSLRRLSRGVWSPSWGVRYILCTESALTTKMTKLTDLLLLSLWWPCLPLFSTACFTLSLSQSLQEAISARQSYIICT